MSRHNPNFETTLEKIARITAKRENLEVKIEGNRACTDGTVIYLPMMEDLPHELKADLEGFLDHEVAHCKFTDFPELNKPKRLVNRFHKELFNAVEDSRIEIEMIKEYSGTEFNLDRLNQKWGAKMNEGRAQMPWPIRLIICIREIRDGKLPKTDAQIEPILSAIYPQAKALAGIDNTKDLLDATEQLIKDINLAREALSAGLPAVDEDEMDEAMRQMRGESSVELDPNRKKKEGKEAQGNEQYDPATERKEDKSGKSEESDSDSDSDSDDESEGEEGDQSGEQSGDQAGMSAETEGKEKGKGKKNSGDGESDAEGLGDESEGEKGDQSGEQSEGDARNKSIETHESVTGDEGDESKDKQSTEQGKRNRPQFDGSQVLNDKKNTAKWSESPAESKMMQDSVDSKESDFDNHVFSSEGYMEIQLEKAIESEPEVRNNHGYYYGKEKEIKGKAVSLPYSREYDEVIDYTDKGDRDEYASRKRKVMKHINPIKSHLERVLKVKENAKSTPERERGTLNTRALAQMTINPNYRTPFKSFTKEDTTNVAVTLLIDCSGSMSGEAIEVARQTALALGEALKAIGISFEALGFNTSSDSTLARKVSALSAEEVARFNRFGETLRLMIFKKFESQNLSGICKAEAGGANADGESIVWAAKRLALRKEKRKILIVLSDGQPSYGGANHQVLASDLKRVIGMLPKAGIEPIGIGIQTDDPKLFYPDWVMVDDLSKLSTVVMSKLSRMLEKGLNK